MTSPPLNTPPPRSDDYYALLYEHRDRHDYLATLRAVRNKLSEISLTISDPGVAHLKLNWWLDEAARLSQNEARHPLLQPLNRTPQSTSLASALTSMATGLDQEIGGRTFLDRVQQTDWFRDVFGPFGELEIGERTQFSDEQWGALVELNVLTEMAYAILNVRILATLNRFRLPETIVAGEIRAAMAAENGNASLLNEEVSQILREIDACLLIVTRHRRKLPRSPLARAALVRATLYETLRDGCRLWHHRIELTPVRKLWIAWRLRYIPRWI